MRIYNTWLFATLILLAMSCQSTKEKKVNTGIDVISFEQLKSKIDEPSDKVRIINFWATWCKPCIEEMPYFESVAEAYKDQVELHFISLDFVEDLENVKMLIKKKNIAGNTSLLNETKYDDFMPKIDKSWTGAIPATLFVDKNGNEYFYEKSFSEKELSDVISGLF